MNFAPSADQRVKLKESEKKGIEETGEHENEVYTNCNWCSWYNQQRIIKWTGGLGNKRMNEDPLNNCIIAIGQNIEKSPGDLKRFAEKKTLVKDHQQTLMWKTPREKIIIIK